MHNMKHHQTGCCLREEHLLAPKVDPCADCVTSSKLWPILLPLLAMMILLAIVAMIGVASRLPSAHRHDQHPAVLHGIHMHACMQACCAWGCQRKHQLSLHSLHAACT